MHTIQRMSANDSLSMSRWRFRTRYWGGWGDFFSWSPHKRDLKCECEGNNFSNSHSCEPFKTPGIQLGDDSCWLVRPVGGEHSGPMPWSCVPQGWEEGSSKAFSTLLSASAVVTLQQMEPFACVSQRCTSWGLPRPNVCFPFCWWCFLVTSARGLAAELLLSCLELCALSF